MEGAADDIKSQVVYRKRLRSKGKCDEECLIRREEKGIGDCWKNEVKYGGFFKELN